jgi:hypothetical protein
VAIPPPIHWHTKMDLPSMDASIDFLLKNPTVVLGILTLVLGFYYWKKQRQGTDVKAYVLYTEPLFSMDPEEQPSFTIHHKDKTVDNVSITYVKVKNRGHNSVVREDFDEPLEFKFGKGSHVLYCQHVGAKPRNLKAKLLFHDNDQNILDTTFFRLEPLILNPRATLIFKLVVANSTYFCDVDGSIRGNATIYPPDYVTWTKDLFRKKKSWMF